MSGKIGDLFVMKDERGVLLEGAPWAADLVALLTDVGPDGLLGPDHCLQVRLFVWAVTAAGIKSDAQARFLVRHAGDAIRRYVAEGTPECTVVLTGGRYAVCTGEERWVDLRLEKPVDGEMPPVESLTTWSAGGAAWHVWRKLKARGGAPDADHA